MSATQVMKVTARQFSFLTNLSPSNACTLGHGTDYTFTYTVNTHPDGKPVDTSSDLNGTAVTENFSPAIPCNGVHTGNGTLNANAQFTDHVAYCSNVTLTCSGQTTQSLSVGGFGVRTNTLTYSGNGVAVVSNGPTQ